MRNERVRLITEMALAIALAAVLNTLKIYRMPNAGTVSFVMLPIIIIALRRGLVAGLVTGALYGVVDFFIDPYPPVHWIQPLLDYPVAYAAVGLAGLAAGLWRYGTRDAIGGKALAVGIACAIAGAARYAIHTVSGYVFFAEYAPAGQNPLIYSAIYNLYVPISAVLAFVACLAVLPALERAAPTRTMTPGGGAESSPLGKTTA